MKPERIDIPLKMQRLALDERGYPVPYFAPIIDGKPDFKHSDPRKKEICRKYKKCWVCGCPLFDKSFWFICGPHGLRNNVASDEAAHEECARFSLKFCPHLQYEKAERKTGDNEGVITQLKRKPEVIYLVKADQMFFIDAIHTRFRSVSVQRFVYKDNKLIES